MFHLTAEDSLSNRGYVYEKSSVHLNGKVFDVPPFITSKFAWMFDAICLCVRCHASYTEAQNLSHACVFHPLGVDRENIHVCCNRFAPTSKGCTPCDHAENFMWNFGESGVSSTSPSVIAIPTVLLGAMSRPACVLATITSFSEENTPVKYRVFEKPRREMFQIGNAIGNPTYKSFVPGECDVFKSLNDNLRYEKDRTYYEEFDKEFISYAIVQRFTG